MKSHRSWDAIILGGGIIGLSLARELRRHGASVLILERRVPGCEASHAAAGMLSPGDLPNQLEALALASAKLYPEFVRGIEDESGMKVDLRPQGSIVFPAKDEKLAPNCTILSDADLAKLEPQLAFQAEAIFVKDYSVDPRALTAALIAANKHRDVDIASGSEVVEVIPENYQTFTVKTRKTHYSSSTVINCCGAWAGEIKIGDNNKSKIPARPVKGQMLSVAARKGLLTHVVRHPEIYLVPRSDGRILIGATVEECGFDKQVVATTIQRMHQSAAELAPEIGELRMLEAWAGLRPSTPDDLPVLGATGTSGYFAATGHFRNGILLAPITARLMAQVVRGVPTELDLSPFCLARFSN